ncbi:MAG: hypothetical protein KIT73_04395 [Burkholderiales bacterium]|nr:hypothetical protein [Burkholderiales bacterium]
MVGSTFRRIVIGADERQALIDALHLAGGYLYHPAARVDRSERFDAAARPLGFDLPPGVDESDESRKRQAAVVGAMELLLRHPGSTSWSGVHWRSGPSGGELSWDEPCTVGMRAVMKLSRLHVEQHFFPDLDRSAMLAVLDRILDRIDLDSG